jgi:hypothetical protein
MRSGDALAPLAIYLEGDFTCRPVKDQWNPNVQLSEDRGSQKIGGLWS